MISDLCPFVCGGAFRGSGGVFSSWLSRRHGERKAQGREDQKVTYNNNNSNNNNNNNKKLTTITHNHNTTKTQTIATTKVSTKTNQHEHKRKYEGQKKVTETITIIKQNAQKNDKTKNNRNKE